MRISVVGLGYVGLVTASSVAEWGNRVIGSDSSEQRVRDVTKGRMPFHEPGLDALVQRNRDAGRLHFTNDLAAAVEDAELVITAVGTHDGNGGWQTQTMRTCLMQMVPAMPDDAVLVIRSTLPPDFIAELPSIVLQLRAEVGRPPLPVVLNPEFTREGSAIGDFQHPDRVVIGAAYDPDGRGSAAVGRLYEHIGAPILTMSAIDAAMAKLGANLFLATKISFANELASLCDEFGATVDPVLGAMAFDPRIGGSFMRPGVGFGGSCLPNQVRMTVRSVEEAGGSTPLLRAVTEINDHLRLEFVERLERLFGGTLAGRRVALLGLTFKPNTDDLRDAPSVAIARLLLDRGALVVATDPMGTARERAAALLPGLAVVESPLDAVAGSNAVCLITEWPEYADLDWHAIRKIVAEPIVVDGRNFLSPETLLAEGFTYVASGRGALEQPGHTPLQVSADDLEVDLSNLATPGAAR